MTTMYAVVKDPAGPATYTTFDTTGCFMGSKLVEVNVDDANLVHLQQVGDTDGMWDEADWTDIATRTGFDPENDQVVLLFANAISAAVYWQTGSDTFDYWVVNQDGTSTFAAYDDDSDSIGISPDQRQELSDLRAFLLQGSDPDLRWASVKPTTNVLLAEAADTQGDDPTVNAEASLWSGFMFGDISGELPDPNPGPPDPFDQTLTDEGWALSDGSMVFSSWHHHDDDEGGIGQFTEDTYIEWSMDDAYSGPTPPATLNLSIYGVENVGEIAQVGQDLTEFSGLMDEMTTAYNVQPGVPTHTKPGALAFAVNVVLFPDFDQPDDFFDHVIATVTRVQHITPEAPDTYKRGQYRYITTLLDDTSTYDPDHLPGTGDMKADFYDAGSGRWIGVLGQIQDASDFGVGHKVSIAIYFEPLANITGTPGPPRRRFFG